MANFDTVSIETIMATGASELHTGSRLAMRGLIYMAYAYHIGAVTGETKPAAMVQNLNDALKTVGMGKGARSTKSNQAKAIGDKFAAIFDSELRNTFATVPEFIQACFNTAQARGADSLLRLVDLAKHGNAQHSEDVKAQKEADAANDKARIESQNAERMANAAPLVSLDLDAVTVAMESPSVSPEVKANTLAAKVAAMSDADLDALAQAIADEKIARMEAETAPIAKAG